MIDLRAHFRPSGASLQQNNLITVDEALKRLRLLVKLIDKRKRQRVYTDFEDELGSETVIELPGLGASAGFDRFRERARQFLKAHEDHVAIHKLRRNLP